MSHSYSSVFAAGQARLTELFKKHGVFFAYSKEQFEQGLAKAGLSDEVGITHLGAGMLCPTDHVDVFRPEFEALIDANNKDMLDKVGAEAIVKYQLGNHEAYYTGCIDSTVDAVEQYDIDREFVKKIYWQELPHFEDLYQ